MSSMPNHEIVSSTLLRKSLNNLALLYKLKMDEGPTNKYLKNSTSIDSQWFTLDSREPYIIFDK